MEDKTTAKMAAAIRVGCEAADVNPACDYPQCGCKLVPAAVKAAVLFALRDAVKVIRHAN